LPAVLAPAERRRTSLAVRLAIDAGLQALAAAGADAADLAGVFGSSEGDGETIHSICSAVAQPGYPVSPTRFHNSVHNAPAGYWSIATGSRSGSSSVCAADDTAAAALLDAAVQAVAEEAPVLLVLYDVVPPAPLARLPQVGQPFAAALLLRPLGAGMPGRPLGLRLAPGPADPPRPAALGTGHADLWANPAARILALLEGLSRDQAAALCLPYGTQQHLALELA
jgi:hypothetical protein